MKMYQDFTVQVAVLFSLCVSQKLFFTTYTHTHAFKRTGKCKTSSVDGPFLYSMIWSLVDQSIYAMMLVDFVCKRPGMQGNN